MNIELESGIKFKDQELLEFLINRTLPEISLEIAPPQDFVFDPLDSRLNTAPYDLRDIEFPLAEKWQVVQKGNAIAIGEVVVTSIQAVGITTAFLLFSRNGTPIEKLELVRGLFNEYDAAIHGADIESWVKGSLPEDISADDFKVKTSVTVKKDGDRRDGNVAQREAFLYLYTNQGDHPIRSEIYLVGDFTFGNWAKDGDVTVRLIGERLVSPDYKPETAREIQEVPAGTSDANLGTILDRVIEEIVPGDCGKMRREDIKLMSLAAWPEFKVEWKDVRVRIGCATVTITIPIIRTRISNLNFYVYFALPEDVGRTVMAIGRTCAIRAALSGVVVGVIVCNPAAAAAAFNATFKICIEREVQRCINPGILILKEAGAWN